MSEDSENKKIPNGKPKFNFYWIYIIAALFFLALQFMNLSNSPIKIDWTRFKTEMLETKEVEKLVGFKSDDIYTVEVFIKADKLKLDKYKDGQKKTITGSTSAPYYFTESSPDVLQKKLDEAQQGVENPVQVQWETRTNWFNSIIGMLLPILIFVGIWLFIMKRMGGGSGGSGGQIFSIGKSKAQLFDKNTKVSITFKDVAGLEEAKEEVMEVVDFLKNPKKYTALGGKIPKGVLLVGPPGTGKTLMAKAVAGEAQVPFFSLSGSDFVEMFVGVGASRVRDLFKQAREKAPCIIFIDEIDAVGRQRGKNQMMGGNDERESTLNQLLVEMDGFASDLGIIMLAATNRPDVLDPALLRPGRFDRMISIDRPDLIGREQIFKVHLRPILLSDDVDPHKLSEQTPGFAGAEIANVCNEAALIAARKSKTAVDMQDFQDAIDRVIGGLEKKNKIISPHEKTIIAYHEAGHAVAGWFLASTDPLIKVSIVPRGVAALGYAQYLPKDQYLYTSEQMIDNMCMTLGGRVAEEIFFGQVSTGAQNDLERITKMAYGMVTVYGMSAKIGNVSFYDAKSENTFMKPYSEATSTMIDEEVRILIQQAYEVTKNLLEDKKDILEQIAKELLAKEVLFKADIERIAGERKEYHRLHLQFIDDNIEIVDAVIPEKETDTTTTESESDN